MDKLDLTGVRIYSNSTYDIVDAMNLKGEEVYLSDYIDFRSYIKGYLVEVRGSDAYPFLGGGIGSYKYLILAKDVKSQKEKKTNVNIKEEMNFIKTWESCVVPFSSELPPKGVKVDIGTKVAVPGEKQGQFKIFTWFNDDWVWTSTIDNSDPEPKDDKIKKENAIDMDFVKALQRYGIIYLPELPSKDVKVEECATIAVPGEKPGQINLYTWYENEWVLVTSIDRSNIGKSNFDLKELKEARDDLENAIRKLNKISSNTKNDELSSKLSKITTKILQAKYELAEDVLDPFENRDTEMWKGLV